MFDIRGIGWLYPRVVNCGWEIPNNELEVYFAGKIIELQIAAARSWWHREFFALESLWGYFMVIYNIFKSPLNHHEITIKSSFVNESTRVFGFWNGACAGRLADIVQSSSEWVSKPCACPTFVAGAAGPGPGLGRCCRRVATLKRLIA